MDWLLSPLVVESEMRLRISDGRVLALKRGIISCRVAFTRILPGAAKAIASVSPVTRVVNRAHGHDEDLVECVLEISDWNGVTYQVERLISANRFLELVSLSLVSPRGECKLLLENVACSYDRRRYIPVTGPI